MSKLDEELGNRFRALDRPLYVDPGLFTSIARRRSRRERSKRVGSIAFVLLLAAAGAGVFALASRSDTGGTPAATAESPSYTSQPAVGAHLPGIPFPACHASTMPGYSGIGGAVYMFARGPESAPCPDMTSGNVYLALYPGDIVRLSSKPIIFGPIECFSMCRVFGSPDIDLKGPQLAVVVSDERDVASIELYSVDPHSATPFTLITTVDQGKREPLRFDWGGSGDYRAGAGCSRSAPRTFLTWHAYLRDGNWHVTQRFMRLRGTTAIPNGTSTYATSLAANLPHVDFCGSTPPTP